MRQRARHRWLIQPPQAPCRRNNAPPAKPLAFALISESVTANAAIAHTHVPLRGVGLVSLVTLMLAVGVAVVSGFRFVRQPQEGHCKASDADSELLQRPAARDGLGQPP